MSSINRIFSQFSLLIISLLASYLHICAGAGGMAEMKALTGDAPYLGTGNQEQAPEYFGEALMRQYYQNPAYAYDPGNYYGSKYSRNYYRTMQMQQPFYRYSQPQQYNGGGLLSFLSYSPLYRRPAAAFSPLGSSSFGGPSSPITTGGIGSPFGGGFYRGRGNEWANN